jgi:hypothetical protein
MDISLRYSYFTISSYVNGKGKARPEQQAAQTYKKSQTQQILVGAPFPCTLHNRWRNDNDNGQASVGFCPTCTGEEEEGLLNGN